MTVTAASAAEALAAGPAALVSVLATEGSAPRGAGARMLVTAGALVGTIGGGALEWRAAEQARNMLGQPPGTWRVQDWPLGPLLGQCCGGRVRVLVERLSEAAWLAAIERGERVEAVLEESSITRAPRHAGVAPAHTGPREPTSKDARADGPHHEAGVTTAAAARGPLPTAGFAFVEPLDTPRRPVMLFGAGHVGRAIAALTPALPLALAWYDSRAEADAAGVVVEGEDSLVACAREAGEAAAVLVLTHDHGLDYRLTAAALASPARFVGLIGSATKRARFVARLAADGVDPARLTCPIGVAGIAGKEPAVIAVAAVAQLLALGPAGMTLSAHRAELLSVADDPREAAPRHHADGLLVVEDGHVVAFGDHADLADRFAGAAITEWPGKLIVPGFVDAHVHYPQTDRIASHGEQLLEWLDRHIFPEEKRFADRRHADAVAEFFCDELLRHGTTSALVFATVHPQSVDALFEAALARGMRIVGGKVLMDLGPGGLADTPANGVAETEALIARWRGRGRIGYAVTPRFALTSSDAQLASAGDLLARHPDALLHTHLAENHGEIAAVAARFPDAADYLDVYDRFGLVGPRSVFAHCCHPGERALRRLAAAGSGIAFCPTSNLFLGSGLFDLAAADRHGIAVGLGTDIGAGTGFSALATMGEAYKIGQLRGASLDPFRALHLATAGAARVMGVADRIGGLRPGQEADFAVLDPAATPLLARRTENTSLHDRLFALQILGDDRAVAATYVAGRAAHLRKAA